MTVKFPLPAAGVRHLCFLVLLTVGLLGGMSGRVMASQNVELIWNPSPDPDVYAYNVYYGTQSGAYNNSATFYYATNGVISGLAAGTTNYFAVSSIDVYGDESALSNEAAYVVPPPDPIVLKAQTFTDGSGQPYLEISARAAVNGSWEMDSSTDLQNWNYYASGYGYGYGNDVSVDVWLDPNEPQMFFRVINY